MYRNRSLFGIITVACFVIVTMSVATAQSEKVKSTLADFKAMMDGRGAPKLQGSDLYLGNYKADQSIVDAMVAQHGGAASLFAKNGDNFVSVASTVKQEDGTLAVGTLLNAKGPAYPKLSSGEPYYGEITPFDKSYEAGYEPLKDASGTVIGAYFVGYPK